METPLPSDLAPLEIPTVDLAPWGSGDPAAKAAVGKQFDAAASTFGFVQIAGHGISESTVEALVHASDAFFSQPMDVKMRCRPDDLAANRGYAPPQSEALAYSLGDETTPDLFEAFNMGEDQVDETDPFYAAERHRMFAPNVWPVGLDGFQPALVSYFAEARRVALTLTDVFASALSLSDGWFRPFVERSTTTMRIINYSRTNEPEMAATPDGDDGGLGMGPHTDYGVVTVLWSDGQPGLQIVDGEGNWRDVSAEPGNLMVNLGDLTAEWTNDKWRSTLHRVLPPSAVGIQRRRSAAFFFDANWDARVECIPTCADAENPPKYPPVLAGEHLMAKLMGPRELRPSEAIDTATGRH